MANGDSEEINLLDLSRNKLKELLRDIEKKKGAASAEAQRIRGLIADAGKRTRTRLPQRRFGFPVQRVKEAQRQVIGQRQEAREFIVEGKEAIGQLETAQRQLKEEGEIVSDVFKAKKIFQSEHPAAIFGLETERQRRFFRAFSAKRKRILFESEIRSLEKRGILERKGKEFEFTEEGIKKVQAGEVDFSKFKFIRPPEIITITTQSPETFSVKVTDLEKKPEKKSFIVRGFEGLGRVESKVADVTTRKIIPKDFAKGITTSVTFIANFPMSLRDPGGKAKITPGAEVGQFIGGVAGGIASEVREHPVRLVALAATGKLVGLGLKGVGLGVTRTGAVFGKRGAKVASRITKFVGIGVAAGAGGLFAVSVSKDIIAAPTATEKGRVVGKSITEVAAFGVGAKVGSKVGDIAIGRFRTRGLKEVKSTKLFDPAERAGKVTFPELAIKETPKQLRARFLEEKLPGEIAGKPRAFTATDIEAKFIIKQSGIGAPKGKTIKSEFPGQFGADVISPNFLRLTKSSSAVAEPKGFKNLLKKLGETFDVAPGEPTVIRSELLKIKIPKSAGVSPGKTSAKVKELSELLGGRKGLPRDVIEKLPAKLKPGEAVIPFLKTERELIIVKGTKFDIKPKQFFVKVGGQRVPIIQRTAIPEGSVAKPKGLLGKVKLRIKELDIARSSSGVTSRGSPLTSQVSSPAISRISPTKPLSSSSGRAVKSSSITSSSISSSVMRSISSSGITSKPISSPSVSIPKSRPRSRPTSRPVSRSLPVSSPARSRVARSIKSKPLSSATFKPSVRDPIRRKPLPPARIKLKGRLKQQKVKKKFTDDLVIIPDVSARVAGITVTIPKGKLKGVASKRITGLGLRAVPLIK